MNKLKYKNVGEGRVYNKIRFHEKQMCKVIFECSLGI